MIHQTWEWNSSTNEKMFAQKWAPEKGLDASIILIHGFGEHSSRYAHMAKFYCKNKIQILTFDLYGHGQSEGMRGFIHNHSTYNDDIELFIEQCHDSLDKKPVFFYGHSMGGEIVLDYILKKKHPFTGVIATAPLIDTAKPMDEFSKLLAKNMDHIAPRLTLDSGLDRTYLSRDKSVVDAYNADPLIFGKVTVRLGAYMVYTREYIKKHAAEISDSLLIMVGSGEHIVSKPEIDSFVSSIPQVTYKVWDGLYHELHNEPEKEEVFAYTLSWIKDHMKS